MACLSQPACYYLLTGLSAAYILFDRHVVVERVGYFVEPCRRECGVAEKALGIVHVDNGDAGHDRSAVGNRQSLADVYTHGFEAFGLENVGRGAPFAFVVYFAFANEAECDVCELHEVAACPNASVLRNEGVYASVYELAQKLYYRGVYA